MSKPTTDADADADAPADTAEARTVSDAALARYRRRMRPWRIGYAVALVMAALVLVTVVKIAYSHGEISHATLHTVAKAPASVPLTTPSAELTRAWTTDDTTALGNPYSDGTIVTYDAHTVRGRNALTGKQTWSYTRTDRTVCEAIQDQGTTIALYELHGDCDELTAVSTGTGARVWDRTLDEDGHPVFGRPSVAVDPLAVTFATPQVVYSIGLGSGVDQWLFAESGCRINRSVVGSAGALISQTCAHRDCSGLKFCGNGQQLLLRGLTGQNTDTTSNKGNPDQILWNHIGSKLVPASADTAVTALSARGNRLVVYDADKGTVTRSLTLRPTGPAAVQNSTASTSENAQLLRVGSTTYAVFAGPSVAWSVPTTAVPTVTGKSGEGTPSLGRALLSVPTSTGIAALNPQTGRPQQRFAVPTPAAGSSVYPLGSGFVVAGPDTTVYR